MPPLVKFSLYFFFFAFLSSFSIRFACSLTCGQLPNIRCVPTAFPNITSALYSCSLDSQPCIILLQESGSPFLESVRIDIRGSSSVQCSSVSEIMPEDGADVIWDVGSGVSDSATLRFEGNGSCWKVHGGASSSSSSSLLSSSLEIRTSRGGYVVKGSGVFSVELSGIRIVGQDHGAISLVAFNQSDGILIDHVAFDSVGGGLSQCGVSVVGKSVSELPSWSHNRIDIRYCEFRNVQRAFVTESIRGVQILSSYIEQTIETDEMVLIRDTSDVFIWNTIFEAMNHSVTVERHILFEATDADESRMEHFDIRHNTFACGGNFPEPYGVIHVDSSSDDNLNIFSIVKNLFHECGDPLNEIVSWSGDCNSSCHPDGKLECNRHDGPVDWGAPDSWWQGNEDGCLGGGSESFSPFVGVLPKPSPYFKPLVPLEGLSDGYLLAKDQQGIFRHAPPTIGALSFGSPQCGVLPPCGNAGTCVSDDRCVCDDSRFLGPTCSQFRSVSCSDPNVQCVPSEHLAISDALSGCQIGLTPCVVLLEASGSPFVESVVIRTPGSTDSNNFGEIRPADGADVIWESDGIVLTIQEGGNYWKVHGASDRWSSLEIRSSSAVNSDIVLVRNLDDDGGFEITDVRLVSDSGHVLNGLHLVGTGSQIDGFVVNRLKFGFIGIGSIQRAIFAESYDFLVSSWNYRLEINRCEMYDIPTAIRLEGVSDVRIDSNFIRKTTNSSVPLVVLQDLSGAVVVNNIFDQSVGGSRVVDTYINIASTAFQASDFDIRHNTFACAAETTGDAFILLSGNQDQILDPSFIGLTNNLFFGFGGADCVSVVLREIMCHPTRCSGLLRCNRHNGPITWALPGTSWTDQTELGCDGGGTSQVPLFLRGQKPRPFFDFLDATATDAIAGWNDTLLVVFDQQGRYRNLPPTIGALERPPLCVQECNEHGLCIRDEFCDCDSDSWTGRECGIPVCWGHPAGSLGVCGAEGSCVFPDNCSCSSRASGERCQFPRCGGIPSTESELACNGHGNCTDYNLCVCSIEWEGLLCAERRRVGMTPTAIIAMAASWSAIVLLVGIIGIIGTVVNCIQKKLKMNKPQRLKEEPEDDRSSLELMSTDDEENRLPSETPTDRVLSSLVIVDEDEDEDFGTLYAEIDGVERLITMKSSRIGVFFDDTGRLCEIEFDVDDGVEQQQQTEDENEEVETEVVECEIGGVIRVVTMVGPNLGTFVDDDGDLCEVEFGGAETDEWE